MASVAVVSSSNLFIHISLMSRTRFNVNVLQIPSDSRLPSLRCIAIAGVIIIDQPCLVLNQGP